MKIVEIETIVIRLPDLDSSIGDGAQDDVVVRVVTDDGVIGIGEVDSAPEIVQAVIDAPSSHRVSQGPRDVLIGADPLDEGLWERLYQSTIYYGRRGVGVHALSGIDIALWDIRGKAAGKPVRELLGTPKRNRVRAYASMLMPDTPGEVKDKVNEALEAGFKAMKLGWGVQGQDPDYDASLARAARETAGDDVEIMIDAGLGYGDDVPSATRLARQLEEAGIYWFEEPFVPDAYEAYAALSGDVVIPIAAGEQESTWWGFRELLERGKVDIAQPDVTRCGGLTEALRIASYCARHNVACVPHAWKSGIIKAATLHLNAVLADDKHRFQECSVTPTGINRDLTLEKYLPDADGYLMVPDVPGLGVELNDDFIAAFRVN